MPSEILISAILILAGTIFWVSGPNNIWEVSQVFFGGKLGSQEILQKSFSDGQGHTFQKFLKFFFWDLDPLRIIKNKSAGKGPQFQKFLKFLLLTIGTS